MINGTPSALQSSLTSNEVLRIKPLKGQKKKKKEAREEKKPGLSLTAEQLPCQLAGNKNALPHIYIVLILKTNHGLFI